MLRTRTGDMTNRELAERVMGDLNELIDKRGNQQLIPALIHVRSFLDDIAELERQIAAMNLDEVF